MPSRMEINLPVQNSTSAGNYTGGGTNYVVQTPSGVIYIIFIDSASDVYYVKSSDYGVTWGEAVAVFTGTAIALAVWYDRWSGIAAGLIHCAYIESDTDDILYRSINTESSDALGTQTTVFAGGTTAGGGALSITRARGGNLVVAGAIDAGAEDGAWESTDVGASWGSAIADPSEASTTDQYLLLPGWNSDTNDVMLIFWDADANQLSVKRYDNSANSWGETAFSGTMTDTVASSSWPHVAAAVDLTNSRNVVVAWSQVDAANADLRCWTVDDTTISEVTNVVLNSTDDQGCCAIAIDVDTNYWYVFYGGNSGGTNTWNTSVNVYYKASTDSGSTWGSETQLSSNLASTFAALYTTPRFTGSYTTIWLNNARFRASIPNPRLRASVQFGI